MDKYKHVQKKSWLQRFMHAIAGLVFAPLFVVLAFLLLRAGERDHGASTNALKKIVSQVYDEQTAKNGNMLLYTDTLYTPDKPLEDQETGLKIKTLKLYRKVYTYQWKQVEHKETRRTLLGGETETTTYSYTKKWDKNIINSQYFKHPQGHENPSEKKYNALFLVHDSVKMGDYQLDAAFYEALNNYTLLQADVKQTPKLKGVLLDTINVAECPFEEIVQHEAGMSGSNSDKKWSFFVGKGTPKNPEIGDTRIEYWYIPQNVYTIVGRKAAQRIEPQHNDSLEIFSELPCGGDMQSHSNHFGALFLGTHNLDYMFKTLHQTNDRNYIILRFIGLVFMVGGFALFGNPLRVLFGWLPFVGKIWEKVVFKLMQVIGTFVSICVSVFYFLKYNNISNLTIYDFYFGVAVILFLLLVNNLRTSVKSGEQEIYSEQF